MSQDSKVLSRAFLGIGLIITILLLPKARFIQKESLLMPFGTTITQTTSMIMVPGIQWLPFALRQITR